MARFISQSDESKYRMYKKAKKKINFVFNINCFMILVACVYGRKHTIRFKTELRNVIGVSNWQHQSHFLILF
jgi:hypothetical protein